MKSNQEWKQWGKVDPLYAVASWEGREKHGQTPWTDEEFYALGLSDWEDFYSHWKTYGCNPTHCVEIGCGAGRLTKHISKEFNKVTALDVSEDQIAYARSRLNSSNVTYCVTDGVHFAKEASEATSVFSALVFQHFDTLADAEHVLREVYRALVPGGTIMIQLPIYTLPQNCVTPLLRGLIIVAKQLGNLRAKINRARGKLIMRGLNFERSWVDECLTGIGFTRVEFQTIRVRSNRIWHEFVMAEKPIRHSHQKGAARDQKLVVAHG